MRAFPRVLPDTSVRFRILPLPGGNGGSVNGTRTAATRCR